jgi:hypothetical protein
MFETISGENVSNILGESGGESRKESVEKG